MATGKTKSGFTLLEILAVLTLVGLITALVFPDFFRGEEKRQLQLVQSLLQADLRQVRGEAMAARTQGTLSFTDDGYYFQIGETVIRRHFDHFKVVFETEPDSEDPESPAQTEAESEASEQSGEAETVPRRDLIVDADGVCTPQQLSWKNIHYQGKMELAEDGSITWSYETEHT